MVRNKWIVFIGLAAFFAATCAFSWPQGVPAAQDPPKAYLPGILDKDSFPDGCVSCHTRSADGDHRITAVLKTVKGHPDVSSFVKVVPKDCGMCHKAGPTPPSYKSVFHKAHYGKKENSAYVKMFQGSCLNCHSMDPKTGKMSVKSGAKNW